MEGVLKGLQGKTLTKKGLFDFLADIDLEALYGKKENISQSVSPTVIKESLTKPVVINDKKEPEEFKCQACAKSFTVKGSLKRHLQNSNACINWNNLPEKVDGAKLTSGLHNIVYEILERAIGNGEELECKHCKTKFTTKGNHHKHFNSSTVCNRLAFQEFKTLFNSL
jgi:hypothetical protein